MTKTVIPVTNYSQQLHEFEIIGEDLDGGGNPTTVYLKHLPSGRIFEAEWDDSTDGGCFETCDDYDGILHSEAVTFSEDLDISLFRFRSYSFDGI